MKIQNIGASNYNCSKKHPNFKSHVYTRIDLPCGGVMKESCGSACIETVLNRFISFATNVRKHLVSENILGMHVQNLGDGQYDLLLLDRTLASKEVASRFKHSKNYMPIIQDGLPGRDDIINSSDTIKECSDNIVFCTDRKPLKDYFDRLSRPRRSTGTANIAV